MSGRELSKDEHKAEKSIMRQYHDLIRLQRLLKRYGESSDVKAKEKTLKLIGHIIRGERKVAKGLRRRIDHFVEYVDSSLSDTAKEKLFSHLSTLKALDDEIRFLVNELQGDLGFKVGLVQDDATFNPTKLEADLAKIIKTDQGLYKEIEYIHNLADADLDNEIRPGFLPRKYRLKALYAFVPFFCVEPEGKRKPAGCVPSGNGAREVVIGWDPRMFRYEKDLKDLVDQFSRPLNGKRRVLVKFTGKTVEDFRRRPGAGPQIFALHESVPPQKITVVTDSDEIWRLFRESRADDYFMEHILAPRWEEFDKKRTQKVPV